MEQQRRVESRTIVRRSEHYAFACGLVPAPLIDTAAVTLILLRMIRKLTQVYKVPYDESEAKLIVMALLGSLVPACFGATLARVSLKLLPGVGPLLAIASTPLSLGGSVRVIGRIFIDHFEAGGDLQNFDLRETLERSPAPATTPAPAPPAPQTPDDLTRVDGVGPRIAELLAKAEITSFAELAAASVDLLREMLEQGGPRFRMHDPSTWPEQAVALSNR